MKRLLALAVLILAVTSVSAQSGSERDAGIERNDNTGLFEFRQIIEAEGSADDLFRAARVWLSRNLGDSDRALDYEDNESNTAAGGIWIPVTHNLKVGRVEANLEVGCRDNRCRVVLTDFVYFEPNEFFKGGYAATEFEDKIVRGRRLREKTKASMDTILEDLAQALSRSTSEDDW